MRKLSAREKYGLILSALVLLAALSYRFGAPIVKKWQGFNKDIEKARQELEKFDRLMALEPSITTVEKELRVKSGLPTVSENEEIRSIIIKQLDETARKSGIQTIDQLNVKPNSSKRREKTSPEVREAFINEIYLYEVKESKKSKESKSKIAQLFPPIPTALPKELKLELEKIISERDNNNLNRNEIVELANKYRGQGTGNREQIKEDIKKEDSVELVSQIEVYQRAVLKKKAELRKLLSEVDTSYERQSFLINISFKSEIEPLVKFIHNLESSLKWFKVESMKISVSDPKRTLLSTELSLMATIL